MGKTKQLLENDWYQFAGSIELHWMEQEFEYQKQQRNDNNLRQESLEQRGIA
jgi:hypothetical protein